jgi:hypothetical protein
LETLYLILIALYEANMDQARSIVEGKPINDSFRLLREALVSKHALSEYQMVKHTVNMEPLIGKKPTELRAAMSMYIVQDSRRQAPLRLPFPPCAS